MKIFSLLFSCALVCLLSSCKLHTIASVPLNTLQGAVPFEGKPGYRVAIIYSKATMTNWENPKLNAQLLMNIQTQCAMAGIGFDLVPLETINDQNIGSYAALIFPYAAFVPRNLRDSVARVIENAIVNEKVVITAENFLTNDEHGKTFSNDSYDVMRRVLGIDSESSGKELHLKIERTQPQNSAIQYGPIVYPVGWYRVYKPTYENSQILMQQTIRGRPQPAALLLKNKVLHVSTPQVLADSMIVAEYLPKLLMPRRQVRVSMSRERSLFFARGDMDQAKDNDRFQATTIGAQKTLFEFQKQFNFVASLYITTGDRRKKTEFTDWAKAVPLYKKYQDHGFEIGTHTISHPEHTHDKFKKLSDKELDYEFVSSANIISEKIGSKILGAAIPGNPDTMDIYLGRFLEGKLSHLTGDYSGSPESGFFNAFGYLNANSKLLYLSPNFYSDYSIISFKHQTSRNALSIWKTQFESVSRNTPLPFFHWHWHDYAVSGAQKLYDKSIFSNFLTFVSKSHYRPEFVTVSEFADRFESMRSLQLYQTDDVQTVEVSAKQKTQMLGTFALTTSDKIGSVKNWYAYNENQIFLPENGGRFEILYAATQTPLTRLVQVPHRAKLVTVEGDGTRLAFKLRGSGKAKVQTVKDMKVDCTNAIVTRMQSGYEINFSDGGLNSCEVISL